MGKEFPDRIPLGRYVVTQARGRALLGCKTVDVIECTENAVKFQRTDGSCFGMNLKVAREALGQGVHIGTTIKEASEAGGKSQKNVAKGLLLNFAKLDDSTKEVIAEESGIPKQQLESMAERNLARTAAEADKETFGDLFGV